ncbi:hypothetical protein TNCV_3080321 [Trichonephila clavipes]|nr:hypothetical protein TNCV_3080321 [Trichonephila clavipes]
MANLEDQSFPPANLGQVDEEMVPPGRGVSQVVVSDFKNLRMKSLMSKTNYVTEDYRRKMPAKRKNIH